MCYKFYEPENDWRDFEIFKWLDNDIVEWYRVVTNQLVIEKKILANENKHLKVNLLKMDEQNKVLVLAAKEVKVRKRKSYNEISRFDIGLLMFAICTLNFLVSKFTM